MSDADSEQRVREAVQRCLGREVESLEEIPAGLGRRRFYRVRMRPGEPETLVARVEFPEDPARRPPGAAPEPALEPLRTFLAEAGIPVPARYGGDPDGDIELLEDVGALPLRDVAGSASPSARRALYEEVCDLVPRLQRLAAPPDRVPAFGRRLDDAMFAYKADFFVRWSLPAALGREARAAESDVVREAFALVAREAAAAPQRLAHRDFQGANILLRASAPPGRRLVLIDLQGALLAPPEYDLVCVLRDSYVELGEAEVVHQRTRVRPALPDAPEPETFAVRFDLLTLTRKGKDHALGHYHASMRRDPRELRYASTCVRYLRAAATRVAPLDPRLSRLSELVHRLPESGPPGEATPAAGPPA